MRLFDAAYRIRTAWEAFWKLYRLKPEQVERFVDSFKVFHREWNEQEYDESVKIALVDYYSVINNLCALGQVEKMYIPPALDLSKNIIANQNLFEERMARDLNMHHEGRALEIGCGRGRVSAHMARYTGAKVNGINVDPGQIESAKRYAERNDLSHLCRFQLGDLNSLPLPFADDAFHHVYEIQALSYCVDLEALFRDIHRVLKPNGRFACLDYVLKEKFNWNDPHHVDLLKRTKPLLGAIGSPRVEAFESAVRSAGFRILISQDLSVNGQQTALITQASDYFGGVEKWMARLIRWRLLPAHFNTLFKQLAGGDAFIEADQNQLLTTSWYIVAEKVGPGEDASSPLKAGIE